MIEANLTSITAVHEYDFFHMQFPSNTITVEISRAHWSRAVVNKSVDNENDVICNATLSNPHLGGEIAKICSRKRIANLHNMDTGEFPNFDTSISILGAIFGEERFETEANAKGKSSLKELHGSQHS